MKLTAIKQNYFFRPHAGVVEAARSVGFTVTFEVAERQSTTFKDIEAYKNHYMALPIKIPSELKGSFYEAVARKAVERQKRTVDGAIYVEGITSYMVLEKPLK